MPRSLLHPVHPWPHAAYRLSLCIALLVSFGGAVVSPAYAVQVMEEASQPALLSGEKPEGLAGEAALAAANARGNGMELRVQQARPRAERASRAPATDNAATQEAAKPLWMALLATALVAVAYLLRRAKPTPGTQAGTIKPIGLSREWARTKPGSPSPGLGAATAPAPL